MEGLLYAIAHFLALGIEAIALFIIAIGTVEGLVRMHERGTGRAA